MNNQRNQISRELDIKGRKLLEFSTENNDKPQFFVSTEDISRVFFYLQHEQSYHIASKGNFHLSHSRRKLHACTFWSRKHTFKVQTLVQNTKLMNASALKERIYEKEPAYQVHFHIYHNEELHWDSPDPLEHACSQVCCTYEPANPIDRLKL